jgi:hypothetical protein
MNACRLLLQVIQLTKELLNDAKEQHDNAAAAPTGVQ